MVRLGFLWSLKGVSLRNTLHIPYFCLLTDPLLISCLLWWFESRERGAGVIVGVYMITQVWWNLFRMIPSDWAAWKDGGYGHSLLWSHWWTLRGDIWIKLSQLQTSQWRDYWEMYKCSEKTGDSTRSELLRGWDGWGGAQREFGWHDQG